MKRISLFVGTVGLLMVILPACHVGHNYSRPLLPLPASFDQQTASDTASIAEIPWKSFFTDPVLQALIDSTLAHNYDLQLALTNIDVAEASLKQVGVAWLPSLNAQLQASTTTPSKNSLNGRSLETFIGTSHLEDYTASLTFAWEIDIWGKIRRQKEAALASYLRTQEAARTVQTQLVAATAQGYYNLLMLDAQLEIARQNLLLSDSTLFIMDLQKTAGEVTQLAVQQAEAQKQTVALLIPQLEEAIAIQENALRLLNGTLPGRIDRRLSLRQAEVPDSLATGFPSLIVSRRPDVRASEQALIAANARLGIAQANLYPTLTISATSGLNAFKASNWFSIPSSLFGLATGSLTQPVFQRRALRIQVELNRIGREQSVLLFRQSVLTAVSEVSNALIRLEKLRVQRGVAIDRVETLQLAIGNARLLFNSGLANYLEVILAQSNVLQSQLALADLERQHLGAMVELYRALGGGWQ